MALLHTDRQVLVRGYAPIRFRCLVEQNRPHRKPAREHLFDPAPDLMASEKIRNGGMQLPRTSALEGRVPADSAYERVDGLGGCKLLDNCEAGICEGFSDLHVSN